jgi:hypothetical protein
VNAAGRQSEAVVQARLGRSPQDSLEAAVVLEAWGGLPAPEALGTGRSLMTVSRMRSPAAPEPPQSARIPRDALPEAIALLVAFAALAVWAPALGRALGWQVVQTALWVAVPATLALQWALRSRYFFAPRGFGTLAADSRVALPAGLAGLAAPAAVLGWAGLLGSALALTCVGALVLAARGWALWHAIGMALLTCTLAVGLSAVVLVVLAAGATAVWVLAALVGSARPETNPRPWRRTAAAGLVGAGLGVLFVADPSADWGASAIAALTVLPPAVGGFWAGLYLARLWTVVPGTLHGLPQARGDEAGFASLGVLAGAAARLLGGTLALSIVLVVGEHALGADTPGPGLFLGFACIGLAILVVSLLDSLGLSAFAVAAVAVGVGVELAQVSTGVVAVPAAGLVAGGAATLLVATPRLVLLLRRPGRTLATALSIP